MGFTEAQAREALQHCRNNLVQATDHVLSLAAQPQFNVSLDFLLVIQSIAAVCFMAKILYFRKFCDLSYLSPRNSVKNSTYYL